MVLKERKREREREMAQPTKTIKLPAVRAHTVILTIVISDAS